MLETEAHRPLLARSKCLLRDYWQWGLLALPLVLCPPLLPQMYVVQATDTLLFILLAVSINLLIGYGGMVSLGHAAYFAIGGYTAGLLVTHAGTPMLVGLLAGPLVATLAAAFIGLFCIRVTNVYFIMMTLAFGQLVYTMIWKWRALTGGDDGLVGIAPPEPLLSATNYYYFTLVIILACLVVIHHICESPFGATLKAIRDAPSRAKSIGIDVRRFQLVAFMMAAFFAGIAGSLYVFHNRGIFPQSAHWTTSVEIMLMAVLGGANSFVGPIVGAVFLKTLEFSIPRVTEYWLFFLGVIVLLIALVTPRGLLEGYDRLRARLKMGAGP